MRIITPIAFLLLTVGTVAAQCPECTPDTGCSTSPAFPAMCPMAPSDATVGEAYSQVVTFWMPPTFTDPGTGFTVDFEQMTITGVSGVPFGLSVSYNNPTGVYYPQQVQHGCSHICGTPLIPGQYPVTISILAKVNYSGFVLDVPQDFTLPLTVLPGSGGNAGFTFTPTTGCGSTEVQFDALIDGSPSPTTHAWDFGDGSPAVATASATHVFDEPGAYTITLETTIGGYVLNEVHLTGVNDNWCGDVEEPNLPFVGCQGAPDLYFILTDGQGNTHQSTTIDNSSAGQWTGLGLSLNTPPYSISFYDEDAISQDDLLGTYNIPQGGGATYNFNVAGGTTGHLLVAEQVQQQFIHTDTVRIFPLPEVVIMTDAATGELCLANDSLSAYIWFLNGDTVPGFTGPCIMPTGPGLWQVQATDPYGCTAMADAVVVCPEIEIVHNGPVLQVPSGYTGYAWTHDGEPVGGNDPFLITLGDGLYTVTVTDVNGCMVTATFDLLTMGLGQPGPAARVAVFPVPNQGQFTVAAAGLSGTRASVQILDAVGRSARAYEVPVAGGTLRLPVQEPLPPGIYTVRITSAGAHATARFLVR